MRNPKEIDSHQGSINRIGVRKGNTLRRVVPERNRYVHYQDKISLHHGKRWACTEWEGKNVMYRDENRTRRTGWEDFYYRDAGLTQKIPAEEARVKENTCEIIPVCKRATWKVDKTRAYRKKRKGQKNLFRGHELGLWKEGKSSQHRHREDLREEIKDRPLEGIISE